MAALTGVGLFEGGHVAGGDDLHEHGVGMWDCILMATEGGVTASSEPTTIRTGIFSSGEKIAVIVAFGHGGLGGDDRGGRLALHHGVKLLFGGGGGFFAKQAAHLRFDEGGGAIFLNIVDGFEAGGADFGGIGVGAGIDEHGCGDVVGIIVQQREQDVAAHGKAADDGLAAGDLLLNEGVDFVGEGVDGGFFCGRRGGDRGGAKAGQIGCENSSEARLLVTEKFRLAGPHRAVEWKAMEEENRKHEVNPRKSGAIEQFESHSKLHSKTRNEFLHRNGTVREGSEVPNRIVARDGGDGEKDQIRQNRPAKAAEPEHMRGAAAGQSGTGAAAGDGQGAGGGEAGVEWGGIEDVGMGEK